MADEISGISLVTVHVEDDAAGLCYSVTVPARNEQEAIAILHEAGSGLAGEGMRNLYLGSVLEPVRHRYHQALSQAAAEIAERRAKLGPAPSEAALRELSEWAVRRRAQAARLWRIPTGPAMQVRLEVRDWRKYGFGGRTYQNLLRRQQGGGFTGATAYENLILSATQSNAGVDASIPRSARHLRFGGGILAGLALAYSAHEIAEAPPEQRANLAKHQAVGFAGGVVGGEAAAALAGVGLGLLVATPPGWVVITVGLVAGLVGGVVGGMVAERVVFPEDAHAASQAMRSGIPLNCSGFACVCPAR
ncbi:hypothetical protein JMJ55_16445 [Belnapia sp. T6]|uniref:Uncharacterized protein n=1 Tax=Belnapia mucosa TaxID=2804532 RepID=A0ABS1V5F1_9PROT|nr:hypothetical protein [Belnapia mucosa]MBL6456928.1 hypothetical protein [Belnapia mucosa]